MGSKGRPARQGGRGTADGGRAASRRGPASPADLARVVAAADDLERAIEALARTPGVREAALAALARRPPRRRPSPWSTAVLVRIAGRLGGVEALCAVVPFLADENHLVQVEAAEALDAAPPGVLRTALERLAAERPDAAFWVAVVSLVEARDEAGVAKFVAGLAGRLAEPGAVAAALEALPYLADPSELPLVRRTLERFLSDTRAVPGAETEEGPVTLALVAAEARAVLEGAGIGDGEADGGE